MEEQWNVILYKTPRGDTPIREFILSLEVKAKSKVEDSIKLLKDKTPPKEIKVAEDRLAEFKTRK